MVGIAIFLVACVLCTAEPTDINTSDYVTTEGEPEAVQSLSPKDRRSLEETETTERCTASGSYCSWCICKCCSGRCLEDNTMGLGFASRCVPWTQCLEQAARNPNIYCRRTRT